MIVRLRGVIPGKRRSQVSRRGGLRSAAPEGLEHPALSEGKCQCEVGRIGASVLSQKFIPRVRKATAGPSTPSATADSAQDDSTIYSSNIGLGTLAHGHQLVRFAERMGPIPFVIVTNKVES